MDEISVFLIKNNSPNFDLKNTISTYTQDFPWQKKSPKFTKFGKQNSKLSDFHDKFQEVAKNIERFFFFFFSFHTFISNMLPNLAKSSYGDYHFSYITRLKNKNPGAIVASIPRKILIELTTLFQGTLETLASRHKGYNTLDYNSL
jgi:hypothetical protein